MEKENFWFKFYILCEQLESNPTHDSRENVFLSGQILAHQPQKGTKTDYSRSAAN